jgi:hypothetical protein
VSSAVDLPVAREHLIYRHPDWLMVPREIAQDVAKVPADSPAYVGSSRDRRAHRQASPKASTRRQSSGRGRLPQTIVRDLAGATD